MAVDTATSIAGFDTAKPAGGDSKAEGDDNFRHIKSVLKTCFPAINGAVAASDVELSYMDGVTSNVQTQLDAKAPIASPALTGTPTVPTATAGTNSTQAASTAFVQAAIAAVNAVSGVTFSTNSATSFSVTDGQIVGATNASTVAVDFTATPTVGAVRGVHFDNGRYTNTIDFGSRSVIGPNGATFSGVMTCDQVLPIAWRWGGDYWRAI